MLAWSVWKLLAAWDLHALESAALSRRTPNSDTGERRLMPTISFARGVISFERCLRRAGQEMAAITRRELAAALGGLVAVLPLAVRAQQPAVPVVGFLYNINEAVFPSDRLSAFRRGLNEAGFA